jgi:septum formation protein
MYKSLPEQIWLASRSPRRKLLLETLGIQVQILLAQSEPLAEQLEAPLPHEIPLQYVERVTRLKLEFALNAMRTQGLEGIVLSADTTVALGQQILGKPQSPFDAQAMLESLSGKTHWVHTAVAAAKLDKHNLKAVNPPVALSIQSSEVQFTDIPSAFIEHYIAQGEPFDKAGGYGIQGSAGQFIQKIVGSHSGIMGLPLFETSQILRQMQQTA